MAAMAKDAWSIAAGKPRGRRPEEGGSPVDRRHDPALWAGLQSSNQSQAGSRGGAQGSPPRRPCRNQGALPWCGERCEQPRYGSPYELLPQGREPAARRREERERAFQEGQHRVRAWPQALPGHVYGGVLQGHEVPGEDRDRALPRARHRQGRRERSGFAPREVFIAFCDGEHAGDAIARNQCRVARLRGPAGDVRGYQPHGDAALPSGEPRGRSG